VIGSMMLLILQKLRNNVCIFLRPIKKHNLGTLGYVTEKESCQSYFRTGGLLPNSSSWRQAPWESQPRISFNRTLAVIVLV
jgi:hypothetical protein